MKIALTLGNFDILNEKDYNLLHRMRKTVVPDGKVVSFLFDNYDIFKKNGSFPVQDIEIRIKNLSFLSDDIFVMKKDPEIAIKEWFNRFHINGKDKIIYFSYDDDKQFPWRNTLRELGIPIMFIKWKEKS